MKAGMMRFIGLLILFMILFGLYPLPMLQANEQEAASVGFMSYNIRHGQGNDGKLDLKRTADVIKQSNADIIALQEVDNNWSDRSEFMDQAKQLGEILSMQYVFAANIDEPPAQGKTERRQYGTAIISKYPIISSVRHPLPKMEETSESRGLLETVINVKGTNITVYCTHMSIIAGERVLQVKELVNIAQQVKGPVIFMGDFNAKPNTFEMRPLFKRLKDAFQGKPNSFTAPAEKPAFQIDYIMYSPDFDLIQSEIISTQASDHLPISARFMLNSKKSQ